MTGIIFDSWSILEKEKRRFIFKELLEFALIFPFCVIVCLFFYFINIDPYWLEFLLQTGLCILLIWLESSLIDLAFDVYSEKIFGSKTALDLLSLKEIEQENSLTITMTPYKHDTFKDCSKVLVKMESPLAEFHSCEFKLRLIRYECDKTIAHYMETQEDGNVKVTDEEIDNCSFIGLNDKMVIVNAKKEELDSLSSYTFPKPIAIVEMVLAEIKYREEEALKKENSNE